MVNKRKVLAACCGAALFLLNLQGCMTASTSLPADKAFALSASALSGIDSYDIAGEVTILGPDGFVSSKASYEGKIVGHGNLKLQWKTKGVHAASTKNQSITSYQPLRLLEFIKDKSALITYAGTPLPNEPVHFQIKLNGFVAHERVADGLRADMKRLRSESGLLKRDPREAEAILSNAEERLEKALKTLKVTTTCVWTANPKNWLPQQLKEETVMTYRWNDATYKEKRVSKTDFHLNTQDGTIRRGKGFF